MVRISSPTWYSLTSLNDIPRPLKAVWYSPENSSCERPRVFISIFRTFFINSVVSIMPKWFYGLRHFNRIKYFGYNVLCRYVFCFSFVCQSDTVAQYIVAYSAHIFGYYIAPAFYERK